MKLVLDSGAVSHLAERSGRAAALLSELRAEGLWPPVVPSAVLVECLTGRQQREVAIDRLLKACDVTTELPAALARRCARLRHRAGAGSAVDAIVVGTAEPSGVVLTGDPADLEPLAEEALGVQLRRVG